ncbi:DUF4157 domain-containing protein [Georgenia wutianyii]|uniref:DUF4157 domain-containing protein n=1 Tax=Georgenia wutianyii TaxID=2585135 RepID=A0ABX5VNK6_9MICO|nr:DUF4157 domain-containing protein [Georgenia wutianyii]QDB79401.1 DUF4157 domain-containing protein [Georgenia wutianyii]
MGPSWAAGRRSQQRPASTAAAPSTRGTGHPLDAGTRRSLEQRFGQDLSTVSVHDNDTVAGTARALGAAAYTVGESVGFARGRYQPGTTGGMRLLSHEIAHVLQQRQGGPPPGPAHEAEAHTLTVGRGGERGTTAATVTGASPGLARSVDEWLVGSPDVESWEHAALVDEIVALEQWRDRQTSSTPELASVERGLARLRSVLQERDRARRAADRPVKRRGPRSRQPAARDSDLPAPRILTERSSVQYTEPADVDAEVDRIMAALERPGLSRADREVLRRELESLAPQFGQARQAGAAARHVERVARIFETSDTDVVAQLTHVTDQLAALLPDPRQPGGLVAYHHGERVVIPASAVTQMRARIEEAFRDGARRTRDLRTTGYVHYETQAEVNEDHPIISAIAGWLGDAEDPSRAMAIQSDLVDAALAGQALALLIGNYGEAARQLVLAETAARRIEVAGRMFNEAHIHGAQRAVIALEITRDVAFGVAAGLSGGLAAGAVFAAGATGIGTTALALGAGSLAGAGTRGGLELAGATGGEGLLALTDDAHSFDTAYVADRTWSGVKSGAIDGLVGAGGALVSPGVTNAVATRFFGGPAASLTGWRSFGANAVSAGLVGAPSGMVGTGLDLADDLVAGRISGTELGSQMFWAGLSGGALGTGTAWVPVSGLHRRGSALFRPSAEPVTPRWMMEGIGFRPFQLSPDFVPTANPLRMRETLAGRYGFTPEGPGFAAFNAQAAADLPPLEAGDQWVRLNGMWQPMSLSGRPGAPYSVHAQGGSYNVVSGGRGAPQRLLQSHTDTALAGGTARRSDQAVQHFREVDATGATTARHGPGHRTALADTPDPSVHPLVATGEAPINSRPDGTPAQTLNESVTNYTPEPYSSVDASGRNVSDWGQHLRRQLEGLIRSRGGGYRQRDAPSSAGRVASGSRSRDATSGTTLVEVPDSIVFIETNAAGTPVNAWRIDFRNPPTARTLAAMDNAPLSTTSSGPVTRVPLSDLAVAPVGATLRVRVPVGQAGAYLEEGLSVIRDLEASARTAPGEATVPGPQ